MFVGDNIRASLISLHILEVSAKVKTKFHSLCLSSLGPLRAGQNCQKTNFPRSDHQPVIDGKLWLSLQLPCPAVGQFCAMFCTIYQSIPTVTDLEIQAQCPWLAFPPSMSLFTTPFLCTLESPPNEPPVSKTSSKGLIWSELKLG